MTNFSVWEWNKIDKTRNLLINGLTYSQAIAFKQRESKLKPGYYSYLYITEENSGKRSSATN